MEQEMLSSFNFTSDKTKNLKLCKKIKTIKFYDLCIGNATDVIEKMEQEMLSSFNFTSDKTKNLKLCKKLQIAKIRNECIKKGSTTSKFQ